MAEPTVKSLREYWPQITFLCAALFFAGGTLAQFQILQNKVSALEERHDEDMSTIHRRIGATNDQIEENTALINDVAKKQAYNQGYMEAYIKFHQDK